MDLEKKRSMYQVLISLVALLIFIALLWFCSR